MSSNMPPDEGQEATRVIGADAPTSAAPAAQADAAPPSEAGLLPVGSRLAEFELTRIVGQGGFGVVYEAWDTDLERVVAIKEYLPVSLTTRQPSGTVMPLSERTRETFDLGMRSFINEARLLAQFDHPSLLKVLRFWQEKGTAYMAMPFYRGETLRQALNARSGGVPEDWLMDILDGVTQALAVMHAANCYHRDIAPDNIILLEDSGRPVLLDFGAARRVITDKTQAITVILKPGYAPIEQYAEMPDMVQGAWTDVYALAAVMHVAVTGRPPPPSVARMLNDSYVPLATDEHLRTRYSARLLSAIDAGLGVRPEQRPQSMAELRGLLSLVGLAGGAATPAPRRAAEEDGGRTVILPAGGASVGSAAGAAARTGSGARIGVAAAVVLAMAGGAGWWWMQQQKSPVAEPGIATQAGSAPSPAPTPATAATEASGSPASASASAPAGAPASATPAPVPPVVAQAPAPAVTAPPSSAPTAAAPKPVTPLESLRSLARGAAAGFDVAAKPSKAEVSIGKDALGFEVRSNRAGFVYVYLLTSGNEMFLLFPNQLDKYNKITPGSPLSLPRASWPMNSGGPPGANEFAVLVSEHERDFSGAGVQDGNNIFQQFSLPAVAGLEASRGTGPAPLLGRVVCAPGTPCRDAYGVGYFRIVEK